MERIKILKGYTDDGYLIYTAKSAEIINYDRNNILFVYDYASLAEKWKISKETLDLLVSYDLNFRQSMYVQIKESIAGRAKSYYIDNEVIVSVLKKLKESGQSPRLNYAKELFILNRLTKEIKEMIFYDNAKD
jgi:hypothetical protein